MEQVQVIVDHCTELPGGMPAIWVAEAGGPERKVRLYLHEDLPIELADHFRNQAIRCAMPGVSFDSFTVTSHACPVAAVAS